MVNSDLLGSHVVHTRVTFPPTDDLDPSPTAQQRNQNGTHGQHGSTDESSRHHGIGELLKAACRQGRNGARCEVGTKVGAVHTCT